MQNIKKIVHEYNKPKAEQVSEFVCRVKQLQDDQPSLEIKVCRDSDGQWLLDEVCERLGGIQEKDYFGLRYTDKDKQKQWLDLAKNIHSQLKETHSMVVNFRIKHYPASPLEDLKQDLARYYLYLQLRKDLYGGRLLGKSSDLYQLAAYAVQSETADFDVQNENVRYLSDIKLLPNLHAKTEAKITDIHKTLVGLSAEESETKFIEKASELDTYGVEPFYVKDQKGNNLYVGLTHEGVSTFQGSRRAHLFKWSDIAKIHYQGKLFIIQVYLDEVLNNQQMKKKHVLGFKCETTFSAAALWKWANDRMCFFSLNRSSEAKRIKSGGGIFRKRKTFRFAGRCQREIMQMSASMIQINDHGSIGLIRNNTITRGDTVQDEEFIQDKSKYNSMPSRERGLMLGTQDTLDSLFIPIHHGSLDQDGTQSPATSLVGSPKPDHKFSHIGTQSLEHITEEPQLMASENIECQSSGSLLTHEPPANVSRKSSTQSALQNSTLNSEPILKRKLSTSNGDIAGALEQLNLAVSETVNHEIIKVIKRGHIGHCVARFLCISCLLLILLSLITLVAATYIVLTHHYRDQSGTYDYSGFFYDIVSNPGNVIRPQQMSQIIRNGYFKVSKYLRSAYD